MRKHKGPAQSGFLVNSAEAIGTALGQIVKRGKTGVEALTTASKTIAKGAVPSVAKRAAPKKRAVTSNTKAPRKQTSVRAASSTRKSARSASARKKRS